ncbi:hypothetical protein K432DRAFT_468728, partial [Lepidopterella palustris CBS 459.81]
ISLFINFLQTRKSDSIQIGRHRSICPGNHTYEPTVSGKMAGLFPTYRLPVLLTALEAFRSQPLFARRIILYFRLLILEVFSVGYSRHSSRVAFFRIFIPMYRVYILRDPEMPQPVWEVLQRISPREVDNMCWLLELWCQNLSFSARLDDDDVGRVVLNGIEATAVQMLDVKPSEEDNFAVEESMRRWHGMYQEMFSWLYDDEPGDPQLDLDGGEFEPVDNLEDVEFEPAGEPIDVTAFTAPCCGIPGEENRCTICMTEFEYDEEAAGA